MTDTEPQPHTELATFGEELRREREIRGISVKEIAETVVAGFGNANTQIVYGGGARGWPGDVPRFSYNTAKLRGLGWAPKNDSGAAIRLTVERIKTNGF